VHHARGNSLVFDKQAVPSIEVRLPGDGGPPAPRAHLDTMVIAKACEGIALFQSLHVEDRSAVFSNMYQLTYSPSTQIVQQGEDGRNFYIVVEGSPMVTIMTPAGEVELEKELYPGDTFGEVALLHSCPRSASVRASADEWVKVWAIDRLTFKELVSASAFKRRARFTELLEKVKLFSTLSAYERNLLADAVVPRQYKPGDHIITQNSSEGCRFHIIQDGVVRVLVGENREAVKELGVGDYFGEVTLMEESLPTASCVAQSVVTTISLDRGSFTRMLGDEAIRDMLSANIANYVFADAGAKEPPATSSPQPPAQPRPNRLYRSQSVDARMLAAESLAQMLPGSTRPEGWPETMKHSDVVFIKELGMGMCGNVYLCKHKSTGHIFVCKLMRKLQILRINQAANIMRERETLAQLRSPFVMGIYNSFQDSSHLYLNMEFMSGGEMFSLLVAKKHFPLAQTRFYASEVLLSLEYIHSKSIVYRDLKPENILIGANGHIKIADMGFAKPLYPGERTYTTCGTADYMAPEVILCQGHDKAVDFWGFGVLLFEMFTGHAPFGGKSDNQRIHRILTSDLVFPAGFNLQAKDLVSKLCVVEISYRLGVMAKGVADIKQHPFFADVDWIECAALNTKPPFIPKQRSVADILALAPLKVPVNEKDTGLSESDDKAFDGY